MLAERLSRLRIAGRPGPADRFTVSSAGTEAASGLGMPRQVARCLRRRGADTESFASRRLSPAIIQEADLVLTASRLERDRVIAAEPVALRRTFTLNEFARLAPWTEIAGSESALDVGTRARLIMAEALTLRGGQIALDGSEDDVPDPNKGRKSIERCAASIDSAVAVILEILVT